MFCWMQDFRCSAVSYCCLMLHAFLTGEQWIAGRQVNHMHSVSTKACCSSTSRMRPCIIPLKNPSTSITFMAAHHNIPVNASLLMVLYLYHSLHVKDGQTLNDVKRFEAYVTILDSTNS